MENKSTSEQYWIYIVRFLGLIIGFLPFIPNALWYLGFKDVKTPIDSSDFFFVLVGFVFVCGSGNFGTWANNLGKIIVNKVKK